MLSGHLVHIKDFWVVTLRGIAVGY